MMEMMFEEDFGDLDPKHSSRLWFKTLTKTDQKTLLLCENFAALVLASLILLFFCILPKIAAS